MTSLPKKFICILLFLTLIAVSAFSQKLDYSQGDFIVEFSNEQAMASILKKYNQFKGRNTSISIHTICTEPRLLYLMHVDYSRIDELDMLSQLQKERFILHVQRNKFFAERSIPNDPLFSSQWQFINDGSNNGTVDADLDIEDAWDITTGGLTPNGDEIVVAVIDDGCNVNHPDMAENMWVNKNEIAGDGIDNDNNGYIDDLHGWNFRDNNGDLAAGGNHGTPVCGIVGAKGNNGIGVSGVNWNVKILGVKYENITEASVLASYGYVYGMRKKYNESNGTKGAFIVATNSSWGQDNGDPNKAPLWCAFYDSLGSVGILSCAATANSNINVDTDGDLPTACTSEYLIAVTNVNRKNIKVTSAGYGAMSIDIGAFGSETYTVSSSSYSAFGGTSGATPHVAGTIALLYSLPCSSLSELSKTNPSAAALLIKDIILNNTESIPSLQNISTTGGRLNVGKVIQSASQHCGTCAYTLNHHIENSVPGTIKFTWQSNANATVTIRYKKPSDNQWKEITSANGSATATGLDNCETYVYQVSSTCNGTTLPFSYSRYFTSSGCCEKPKSIESVSDDNAIIFVNNQVIAGELIKVLYRPFQTTNWDSVTFVGQKAIGGLPTCKLYEYKYYNNCTALGVFSDASNIGLISTNCDDCTNEFYCTPSLIDNSQEWIKYVKIDNTEIVSEGDANGYGRYLGYNTPVLKQGKTYNFSFEPGYAGNTFGEYFTMYIDTNHDLIFDNNDLHFDAGKTYNTKVDTSFTVPEDAIKGLTRMRVVMSYDKQGDVCGAFDYGEIEDYCIEIQDRTSIENPSITSDIKISPNPVNDLLYIQGINDKSKISLFNSQGAIINNNFSNNVLDVKGLISGIYFIKIVTEKEKTFYKKFIKI